MDLPEGFKKKEPADFWKPEKGMVLVGNVSAIMEGNFGKQYVIKADDGTQIVTPSHAILQALLRDVNQGQDVIIECLGRGEAKQGQSAPFLYEVAVKE